MYQAVKEHKSSEEILEQSEGAAARFEKQIRYMRFVQSERESDRQLVGVKVYTLYGASGVGKTYAAINILAGGKDYYICEAPSHKDSKVWFDGYEGQKTLILDDFEGNFCSFRYLLRLLDHYKFKVEVKGGFAWATWTTVVITSNIHPAGWYTGHELSPLRRRLVEKGSEIRLLEHQGSYTRMDWNENRLDADMQSLLPPVNAPLTPMVPATPPTTTTTTTTTASQDDDPLDGYISTPDGLYSQGNRLVID